MVQKKNASQGSAGGGDLDNHSVRCWARRARGPRDAGRGPRAQIQ